MEKETQPPPHPGSTDDAVRLEGGVRGEEAGETDTVVRRDKGVRDEEAGSVFRREGGGRDEEVGATEAAVRRREKEGSPSVPAPPPPAREDAKQSVSHDEERPPVPAPPTAPAEVASDITGEKDVTQSVSHQEERSTVPAPPPAPAGEDVDQSVSHHGTHIPAPAPAPAGEYVNQSVSHDEERPSDPAPPPAPAGVASHIPVENATLSVSRYEVQRLMSAIEVLMEIEDTIDYDLPVEQTIALLVTMADIRWCAILRARCRARWRAWRCHIMFIVGVVCSTVCPILMSDFDLRGLFCLLGFVLYTVIYWNRVVIRRVITRATQWWWVPTVLDIVMGYTSTFVVERVPSLHDAIYGYTLLAFATLCVILTIRPTSDYGWLLLFSFFPSRVARRYYHDRINVCFVLTMVLPFICMMCQAYLVHYFRRR